MTKYEDKVIKNVREAYNRCRLIVITGVRIT